MTENAQNFLHWTTSRIVRQSDKQTDGHMDKQIDIGRQIDERTDGRNIWQNQNLTFYNRDLNLLVMDFTQ